LGQFLSIDPESVSPDNPFSFSRYAYGNNNPYKYVDPDGRMSVENFPTFPQPFVDSVAGFGDGVSKALTLGFYSTSNVRQSFDIGGVDLNSKSYSVGKYSGEAWGTGTLFAAGLNGGSNSVFWSGYSQGAQKAAMELGTTIEKTPIGKTMDFVHNQVGLKIPDSMWKAASATFAANAKGTATAVVRSNNPASVWASIEQPILNFRQVPIVFGK